MYIVAYLLVRVSARLFGKFGIYHVFFAHDLHVAEWLDIHSSQDLRQVS